VLQRVAQWLAQRVGQALQQVGAGAHAVWKLAVWQWLICVVQQLTGRHRDGQSSSSSQSSSSARADWAASSSTATSAAAVISRFSMVFLLVCSVSDCT
jgi:hypothetical protein